MFDNGIRDAGITKLLKGFGYFGFASDHSKVAKRVARTVKKNLIIMDMTVCQNYSIGVFRKYKLIKGALIVPGNNSVGPR